MQRGIGYWRGLTGVRKGAKVRFIPFGTDSMLSRVIGLGREVTVLRRYQDLHHRLLYQYLLRSHHR